MTTVHISHILHLVRTARAATTYTPASKEQASTSHALPRLVPEEDLAAALTDLPVGSTLTIVHTFDTRRNKGISAHFRKLSDKGEWAQLASFSHSLTNNLGAQ